jgi:subtilisin-like proprotein convertase family protein
VVTATATEGVYVNTARVIAMVPTTGQGVTATDTAADQGFDPTRDVHVTVTKALDAVNPNAPTALEISNVAPGKELLDGTHIFWTYQVTNTGIVPLSFTSLVDDAGTPAIPTDDFQPQYVSGDANTNNLIDPGETWLFTSVGVVDDQVVTGPYVNTATVTATVPGTTVTTTATASNYHVGMPAGAGLTPGFWKNNARMHNASAWPTDPSGNLIYSPSQTLGSVFQIPASLGLSSTTLSNALGLNGGGANALIRQAVAALLNTTSLEIAYPIIAPSLIQQVNAALASGNANTINTLETQLDNDNNLGANLSQQGYPPIAGANTASKTYSNTTAVAIPDLGTATSSIAISDAGTIDNLTVELNINHPRDSDLVVTLIGPDGTQVPLFSNVGGMGAKFTKTVLDDSATVAISAGTAPFTGTFSPSGYLSTFIGKSLAGTWTLQVQDTVSGKTGTLVSWSLMVDYEASPLLAAAPASSTPVAGVTPLTETQLAPIVAEARSYWVAAGASSSALDGIAVRIADLPGDELGTAFGHVITLDANADGHGWILDPAPGPGTAPVRPSAPSQGAGDPDREGFGFDLLTVVAHEMGHMLGFGDLDPATHPNDVMAATLEPGTQHLSDAAETRPAARSAAVATTSIGTPVGALGVPVASTPVAAVAQTSKGTVPLGGPNGSFTTQVMAPVGADSWATKGAAPRSGAGTSDPPAPVLRVHRRHRSTTARRAPSAGLALTRHSARRAGGHDTVLRHHDARTLTDAQPYQPIEVAGLFDRALEAFASEPKRLKSSATRPKDEEMRDSIDSLALLRSRPAQGSTTDRYTLTIGAVTPRQFEMRRPGALRP